MADTIITSVVNTPSDQIANLTKANTWTQMQTIPALQFVTTVTDTPAVGKLYWNSDDGTLNIGMVGGNVNLQVGQEQILRVKNNEGSTINNGEVVYISGASGANILVKKADADIAASAHTTIGVATENILNNAFGFVTLIGLVRDVNTASFSEGDVLWLSSTAGAVTNVVPAKPAHAVRVGYCLRANANNGVILVHIDIGDELTNLHDVSTTSLSDRNILQYESSTGLWKNSIGKFGGTSNYTEFEADGTLKMNGDATVWTDIDFPIIIRTTGAGIPTQSTFNGNLTMPQWAVNDFNMCESQEFIHAWAEGTTCYWHIHYTTNGLDATDRYVRFELEYAYSVNGVWTFPAVFTSSDILIPANTPDKKQIIMPITNFTPTGAKIGDHCLARLKRVAAVGTAPSGNPWIPMLQMHIQEDTIGSRAMTTK